MTEESSDLDLVVSATPIDITRLVNIEKPVLRVRYGYRDNSQPTLGDLVLEMLAD